MEFKFVAILLAILFAACAIASVKSDDVQTGKRINNVDMLKYSLRCWILVYFNFVQQKSNSSDKLHGPYSTILHMLEESIGLRCANALMSQELSSLSRSVQNSIYLFVSISSKLPCVCALKECTICNVYLNSTKKNIHCDDETNTAKRVEKTRLNWKRMALELHVVLFSFQIWVVMVCLHQMCCIAPWSAMKKDFLMDIVTVNVAAFAAIVDARHECFDIFGRRHSPFSNEYSTVYCIPLKVSLSGRSFECAGNKPRGWN